MSMFTSLSRRVPTDVEDCVEAGPRGATMQRRLTQLSEAAR
jgi:hypothetical protein